MPLPPQNGKRDWILWLVISALALAVYCSLSLQRWGIDLSRHPIDYARFGSWSEAITGVATSLAVFVALGTLYRDRLRDRRAEDDRETERETAVYHWLTSKELRDEEDNRIGRVWDLRVQNSTSAPIYRWRANFSINNTHLCNFSKRPLLPGENVLNLPFLDNLSPNEMPEVNLIFEGRSSRIWLRSPQGTLEQGSIHLLQCEHSVEIPTFQVIA